MKLARIQQKSGDESWGIVDLDASTVQPVVGTILDWGEAVTGGSTPELAGDPVPFDSLTFLAPIEPSSTVFGVGMNYWAHLEKLGVTERPATTVGYVKPRAAILGHEDTITYPSITQQLDYEIELVVVIGRTMPKASGNLTESVLGYTVGNDTSARDAQSPAGGPDLFTMKGCGHATPIGPWITTKDELGGAGQIDVEIMLRVNGEERQRDRTNKMLFSIDECLDYVAARVPLVTGDVLFTGTTHGVGAEGGRWLEPGDVVESEVSGIGVLRNTVGPRP
jgi:2-keto-4-pentenoate hydratase/2-oxohepta-3-ene-1,7-dioic acid hydratase in catechol pathway